ncbi:MAG TPA: tRNA lysidine(34) synthetase TilS, partial [Burkholderiaceae bacterium]
MSFIKIFADHIQAEGLLQRDDRVVVGVSGGPDSMALLHGLVGLNTSAGFQLALHIVHLNHQLRGEAAEQDAAFVQAAADDLELSSTIERRDIRALAGAQGAAEHSAMEDASWLGYAGRPSSSGAIEETARRERYALFERAALATDSNVICVGHQADDNAETILHRIVRGTGLRGMAGIPARRRLRAGSDIWLVRPLLRFPRRKLLEFLADAGIPYREDESNAYPAAADVLSASRTTAEFGGGDSGRPAPMRNFIRNVALPLLEAQINPHVREALLRLAEQARWVEEHLAETVLRNFETLVVSRSERELVLSARALARRSRIIQAEVLRHAIISLHVGEQDLSFTHLSSVCDLLAGRASG